MNILKQIQLSVVLLSHVLKGGSGSGNFGHAGIPGQVGGSSSGGGGSGGDKTPTGTTTRTLDRIRGNTEKAFPGARITPTSSGSSLDIKGSLGDVEDGLGKLGLDFVSNGRYSSGMDSAGVKIIATVNTVSGDNKSGLHIVTIERTGKFIN